MAFIRNVRFKKKNTIGTKAIVVVGDDSETNEVNTVDISILAEGDAPNPTSDSLVLPLKVVKKNGNKRFVNKDLDFEGDPVNFSYTVTAVMKDVDNNQVGESFTGPVKVEDDGDSRVRSVRITQIDDTNFRLKVVIIGDSENNVDKVEVLFADFAGPEPEPTEILLENPKVNGGKKVFKDTTLTFSDPAAAADEVYDLVIDLKGADSNSLGSTEFGVVVEGLDEDLA